MEKSRMITQVNITRWKVRICWNRNCDVVCSRGGGTHKFRWAHHLISCNALRKEVAWLSSMSQNLSGPTGPWAHAFRRPWYIYGKSFKYAWNKQNYLLVFAMKKERNFRMYMKPISQCYTRHDDMLSEQRYKKHWKV